MKHHKFVSRVPLRAQTDDDDITPGEIDWVFIPGLTSLASLLNFMVALFGRAIEYGFRKSGHLL